MLQRLRHRIYLSLVLLGFSTVIHAADILIWQIPNHEGKAPVFYQKASTFSKLSPIFKPLQTVQVLCQQKNWYKLGALDNSGQEAWIPSSDVTVITKLRLNLQEKEGERRCEVTLCDPKENGSVIWRTVSVGPRKRQYNEAVLLQLNARVKELLGYSLDEAISKRLGRPLYEVISEMRGCSLEEVIQKILGCSLDDAIKKMRAYSLDTLIKEIKGRPLDEMIEERLGCPLNKAIQDMKDYSLDGAINKLLGCSLEDAIKTLRGYSLDEAIKKLNEHLSEEWGYALTELIKSQGERSLDDITEELMGYSLDEAINKMKAASLDNHTVIITKQS